MLLCTHLIIFAPLLFIPTHAEMINFNTLTDKEVEVDLDVTLGRIDLDKKEVNVDIDFEVEGPEFFEFYLQYPGNAWTYQNGTKESNASWYEADPPVARLVDIVIELDTSLSLWPFDSYSTYLYAIFHGEITTEYDLPLETSKHQDLFRDEDWKVDVYPELIDSRDKFPSWIFKDEVVTMMGHKITVSHTDSYIVRNVFYFLIPATVFTLIITYFITPNRKDILKATFFGSVGIVLGTVFPIRQITPHDFTVLELLSWIALAVHVTLFIISLKKEKSEMPDTKIHFFPIEKKSEETSSLRDTKIKDHINALLQQLLEFKQTRKGHLVDLNIVLPKGGILRIDDFLERFPSYRNLLSHFYTDPNNKKVYDLIYELTLIKTYFKNFEKERNKIEREKVNEVLIDLEKQSGFEQNGQILINKSTKEILNIYDLKEFLGYHLILKDPKQISIVETKSGEVVGLFELRFPGKGLLGHLTKNNAEFLERELNNLTNGLLDSVRQFHAKLKRQRELLSTLERYIEDILQEIELKGEPLGGCCSTCLNENFRISQEMEQYKTKLSEIPWSELNLRTPDLYKKEADFIEIQLIDPGIYEIIIDDPCINAIDEAYGIPFVFVNDDIKNPVKMIQSTEGSWHVYIGKELSQSELVSKIFHFYKPNNHPNVLKTTGLGQSKLKENEWPFIQKFDLNQGDSVSYSRGGENHTVKI